MASRAAGSSPARAMRLSSSRQERPASTRTRVREEEMTVLLPLEPEASTVMRIIRLRYACCLWVLRGNVSEMVPVDERTPPQTRRDRIEDGTWFCDQAGLRSGARKLTVLRRTTSLFWLNARVRVRTTP